jgi:mono/diheme cytochrome c family protein
VALAAAAAGWALSAPSRLADIPDHQPDPANGEMVFHAGGCASCHAAPEARGDDKLRLAGGLTLATDFGTFVAPNVSPHPEDGIGGWSTADFVNAVMRGVSPTGAHYYPAFPYTSYVRMRVEDVIDLKAFMDTLPAVEGRAADHDLAFPFSIRRGVGLWKRLYLDPDPVVAVDASNDALVRGRYLVEGPGHCGECHTARNAIGGLRLAEWLAGAANPEGRGRIPNITPGDDGIGGWSEAEVAALLDSGFTPEFDSVGGRMAAVVENLSRLPEADVAAMAAYLKAVPALPDAVAPADDPESGG